MALVDVGAPPADSLALEGAELESEIHRLEVRHVALIKEEHKYRREATDMKEASKLLDEEIERLRDRYTATSGELGEHVMSRIKGPEEPGGGGFTVVADNSGADKQLVSYNSLAGSINAAYRQALQNRLQDAAFVQQLSKKGGPQVVHCRVHWGEEAIDWKVYDDGDGTEMTVGAMLQDAARYWGLRVEDVALQGRDGAVWCHEGYVHDELRQARARW